MSEGAFQTDLFGGIKRFFSGGESEKVEEAPPQISGDGTVLFRYADRLKKSIRCRKKNFENLYELELPGYMKTEEFYPVRELAAEWARVTFKRKTASNKQKSRDLLARIWKATDQILTDIGQKPVIGNTRFPPIRPVGNVHDLNKVFAAINETYFQGELQARITWSNRVGGLSFHSKRTDPLTGEEVNLISISRGYDFENCPLYAVFGVVYHECLHIVIPPVMENGRRIVHGKNFRQRERRYIYYEQWIKWHKEVLPKNIRMMRRTKNFW
ncbi:MULTISPECIES: hypothetical protein [Hallerella]|uniref:hypothetical protein n=1 Tax=Hallerella TaxID=2815788 RepID=UPI000D0CD531|nr:MULTISPECIES: hypothetical protein [Hallerella]MCI6874264.1 hypothetical protein [Hallerella sp.]MDY5030109.1 hypothetical protein [Hallerella succinigenes]